MRISTTARTVSAIAAYGNNLEKLAEVKGKWDSANLFRQNKNIAPKTEAATTA